MRTYPGFMLRDRCSDLGPGFTLTELLLVVAIVSVLAALLLPAAGVVKRSAQSTTCANNLKQLQMAWLNYAHDNDERLVPNRSRTTEGLIQRSVAPSWVLGNAKWDAALTNLQAGLLFAYVPAPGVYRCPSDASVVKGELGVLRLRSYSLSAFLGGDIEGMGMQGNPKTEPRLKDRLQAVRAPARVFAFIDEHSDGIDDGLFGTYDPIHWAEPDAPPEYKTWLSLPSDRHNQGCNLSFADGHTEHWSWKCPKLFEDYDQPPANNLDKDDLQKLQAVAVP